MEWHQLPVGENRLLLGKITSVVRRFLGWGTRYSVSSRMGSLGYAQPEESFDIVIERAASSCPFKGERIRFLPSKLNA